MATGALADFFPVRNGRKSSGICVCSVAACGHIGPGMDGPPPLASGAAGGLSSDGVISAGRCRRVVCTVPLAA